MKPDFWLGYLMGITMVLSISANFQRGGHDNDDIWDPNFPKNWKNDNNKGRPPNKEL